MSRKRDIETISKTISNSIERWKNDTTQWSEKSLHNHIKAASILRLIQWGEVGALKKFRDNICDNSDMPNSHDFYGCCNSKTAAFYPLLFPLFASDIAIKQMSSKLNFLLHQWQNYLNDLFMKKDVSGFSIGDGKHSYQGNATLISAYIFCVHRLSNAQVDQNILDKSVQYLLDNQTDTGLWGYDQTLPDSEEDDFHCLEEYVHSRKHVVLAAMGIHALFMAQPFGAKKCIEKAAGWLLKQQQADGGWYHLGNPKYPYQVHTTVMVLDAMSMATTGDHLTFTPNIQMDSKDCNNGGVVTKTDDLSINEKTQTICYEGKKINIGGGGATWLLFLTLYENRGEVVSQEDLRSAVGVHDIHKVRYDLCQSLRNKGADELAEKIKNAYANGYYLEI
jgi:DNA-binding response OmpR family regulator